MANTFKFQLVCPEKVLISMEADAVIVPGVEGNFTVLAQHAPVISALRPGILEVEYSGNRKRLFVKSGFADINGEALIVLAETAFDLSDITSSQIQTEINTAERELEIAQEDEAKLQAVTALECLRGIVSKAAA